METGIAPLKKVMGRAKPKNKVGRGLTNKDKGKGKEGASNAVFAGESLIEF